MWYNKLMKAGSIGIIIFAGLVLLGSCSIFMGHYHHCDHDGCPEYACACAHTCRCAIVQNTDFEIDQDYQIITIEQFENVVALHSFDIFRPPQPLS
jgi:hypothetical protein